MASSPFRVFRKHQKVIFAGLTILCMLTFVMCTGMGGDVGDWLLRVLGGREKSPQVAMLYDSKVTLAPWGARMAEIFQYSSGLNF